MTPITYASRWILPIDGGPIENGEVIVENGQIAEVRPRQTPANECRDFGDAVLMPGLVNAHTHLEYSVLRGFLEDIPFFPWIRALTAAKVNLTADDWLWSTRLGALECLRGGITTVGDNTDAGVSTRVLAECGMRGTVYQELFGIDDREAVEPIIDALLKKVSAHRHFESGRVGVGVSPHALYTIRPALFAALNTYLKSEHLPTSIHIAESPAEFAGRIDSAKLSDSLRPSVSRRHGYSDGFGRRNHPLPQEQCQAWRGGRPTGTLAADRRPAGWARDRQCRLQQRPGSVGGDALCITSAAGCFRRSGSGISRSDPAPRYPGRSRSDGPVGSHRIPDPRQAGRSDCNEPERPARFPGSRPLRRISVFGPRRRCAAGCM
jgi:hypothetical protein